MCQPGVSDDILVLISTRGVEWSVFISKSVFLRVVFNVVGITMKIVCRASAEYATWEISITIYGHWQHRSYWTCFKWKQELHCMVFNWS